MVILAFFIIHTTLTYMGYVDTIFGNPGSQILFKRIYNTEQSHT